MPPIQITLSKADYEQLLTELRSLDGYHTNNDRIDADNCGSKVLSIIEASAKPVE